MADAVLQALYKAYDGLTENRRIVKALNSAAELAKKRYHFAGASDGDVAVEVNAKKLKLTAKGETLGFLEFGAGVFTTATEMAEQVQYEVAPGSWSRSPQGKGIFAARGYWYCNGKKLVGLMPSYGMYEAKKYLERELEEIARVEV